MIGHSTSLVQSASSAEVARVMTVFWHCVLASLWPLVLCGFNRPRSIEAIVDALLLAPGGAHCVVVLPLHLRLYDNSHELSEPATSSGSHRLSGSPALGLSRASARLRVTQHGHLE